ncbi:MAG: hypothetical protein ACR2RV_06280 [Verrucomicrobiales bacterium]
MTTEEAKLILSAVHLTDREGADAEVSQAFEQLGSDPELARWYEQECAFDTAVTDKLASVEAPADLRANLLALLEGPATDPIPEKDHSAWFRPRLLAAAAAIILIPFLSIQLLTNRASAKSFDSFRSDMVEFAVSDFKLDHRESDLPKLYAWLNANNATCPTEIPDCVGCPESIGCKVVAWNDENVTLICLRNKTREVVHCFVVPRDQFDDLPDEKLLRESHSFDDLETCGWTDQENVYLLVGSASGVKVNAPIH